MTVDEFIRNLEELSVGIQSGVNGPFGYAAERTAQRLRELLSGTTNLKNNISYAVDGTLFAIIAPSYLVYQNYGVEGTEANRGARTDEFSGRVYSYGTKQPPAQAFAAFAADPSGGFASARTVYKFGIKPKNWFSKQQLIDAFVDYSNEFINDNL